MDCTFVRVNASHELQIMPSHLSIPKTALVVDDSMLIRHSVCRFLEERGFIVESATNGIEALAVLDNFVPDVIITDLSMPRMGGVELASRIRQLAVFADTPILVLAAKRTASETSQMPAGTAAVIFKDIDIEEQLSRALDSTLA
jgi:CheY-like chemotaxis protein